MFDSVVGCDIHYGTVALSVPFASAVWHPVSKAASTALVSHQNCLKYKISSNSYKLSSEAILRTVIAKAYRLAGAFDLKMASKDSSPSIEAGPLSTLAAPSLSTPPDLYVMVME